MGQSQHGPVDLPLLHPRQGAAGIRGVGHRVVEPGTRIGAFRIDRLIAAGPTGAVYEATQVSLRRVVALRLIEGEHFRSPEQLVRFDQRQRLASSVHHPNLVPFYEVGAWAGGRFIATRLIRGLSLGDLRAQGSPPTAESLGPLEGALRAAHGAGLAHGRVSAENILIEPDGTPYLADLGLFDRGTREGDERALADVVSGLPGGGSPAPDREGPGRRRPGRAALAALGAVLAAAIVALALAGDDDPQDLSAPPPSPPGTSAVGSSLVATSLEPLGCGAAPNPNTPACTLEQTTIGGSPITVERAGVIRNWAVRGASGDLALQVIRERGGKSFVVGFSQPERLEGPSPEGFAADIGVRPGDRIGVRLSPGAAIGARMSSPGSELVRWDGGLTADSLAVGGTTLQGEIMMRADIEFGARPEGPDQLLGREAATARAGRELADVTVGLSGRRAARAVLVELPDGIAIDVIDGRRLARIRVPDADPEGELFELGQACGGAEGSGFCLLWRNPGGEPIITHTYRVHPSGRINLLG